MKFVIASDTHYIAPALVQGSTLFEQTFRKSDGKQMDYIDEILEAFIEEVIDINPDGGLIISGDLTFNGEMPSHQLLAEKLSVIKNHGINVFIIPGNHDINNYRALQYYNFGMRPIESVSPLAFEYIYYSCGFSNAIFRDQHSLSYIAIVDNIWLFMLDSCIYEDNNPENPTTSAGYMREETLTWLEEYLIIAREKGVIPIIIAHHNLVDHNEVYYKGFTVNNNISLLKLLHKYHISIYLSGHMHIQSIASSIQEDNIIYDIATSSLAVYNNHYGIFDVDDDGTFTYNTKRVNLSAWANHNQRFNPDLIFFEAYSFQFFTNLTLQNEFKKLISQNYNPADAEKMARILALLNPAYFSGNVSKVQPDIWDNEGYKLWQEIGVGRTKQYIQSMLKPVTINENSLKIKLRME
ncbi:MAG: metallophosphoesterase [Oscillospiraceae bacterium]